MTEPVGKMTEPVVTIFGSSAIDPAGPAYQTAYDLGRRIALAGWKLCNGGYGGTMEAACKGACEAGGQTIGVTCKAFNRPAANRFVRQEISTPSLMARLDKLVHLGDAFLVLPGGTGTLLELALVWELLNKRLIGRQTPLILLGDFWTPLIPLILAEQPEALRPQVAPTVEAAVALLAAHFEGRASTPDARPSSAT
ncbi:MAG: LOG family protein [Phycisphaerae bacterium]|nr:LOG family protein [Phycisphaerae bacterium]